MRLLRLLAEYPHRLGAARAKMALPHPARFPFLPAWHPSQVRYATTGNAIRYPWPTLNEFPPSRRPAVRLPTTVPRRFSAANAVIISLELAVCSLTRITTRP